MEAGAGHGETPSGAGPHAACPALCRLRGRVALWDLSRGFGLATQEPWIQFATIRDNILFGKAYDAQLYKEVLEACALNDDLSVSAWPGNLLATCVLVSLTPQTRDLLWEGVASTQTSLT